MTIKEKIKAIFDKQSEWSAKEIADKLLVSKQMVHIVLNSLVEEGLIKKLGRAPKTVYRPIGTEGKTAKQTLLTDSQNEFLLNEFLLITEAGEMKDGLNGFEIWCRQRNLPIEKTVNEFISTRSKYLSYFDPNGFIDGMEKLKSTKGFSAIHLDRLYYLDFYAMERFGKTKLGTLLHYAKQGQSKFLMKILVDATREKVHTLCKHLAIDAALFVPPTIKREVQLMKFLQTHINLSLPMLKVRKISGIIPVPQKSLTKLEERITNAQITFAVAEDRVFNHVLLIDDAVGSGATVNEIAGKLKQKGVADKVSALAITGSFEGFDVITDV